MSEQDLQRLETLLWERAVPHGGMPMEMLDGYFSALVTGPDLVLPSEYLPRIWGGDAPKWESIDDAQEAMSLLMGYWNHVVHRLGLDPEEAPEICAPAIMMSESLAEHMDAVVETGKLPEAMDEDDRTFPLASAWAAGFFTGVELREDAWSDWADDDETVAEDIDDIETLLIMPGAADEDDDADDDEPAPQPPNLLERVDIMLDLPHKLHSFNLRRLAGLAKAQGPVRREAGPGRNDPCPCGSGKKYKKCCGDPSRLH